MTEPRRQGRPKSEEKRQDILRAASTLFLKEGFANTSMDSVAKASGVSKQTVYSHFSSKDSLFKAAIGSKCRSYQLDALQIDVILQKFAMRLEEMFCVFFVSSLIKLFLVLCDNVIL